MHFSKLLISSFLATPQLISACDPHVMSRQADSATSLTYPDFKLGSDNSSDPATLGYFVNHLCIKVKNTTESIDWYSKVFGLRHIFTQYVSEHLSITYMGHSAGGRNGTGFQAASEMNRDKNNRYGMVEFLSTEGVGWDVQTTTNGLHHIGMIVPDIEVAQKRLEAVGAKIIKPFGAPPTVDMPPYADLAALDQAEQDTIFALLTETNTALIWVEDPSGNVVEIQGQEGFSLS